MAHNNVLQWKKNGGVGPRPCDWCGCTLDKHKYIHQQCPRCKRKCYREEEVFYTQLGYDGMSDLKVPDGYNIRIHKKGEVDDL